MSDATAKKRPRPAPELVHHRHLAARLGMSTETVRGWIERRILPRPHAAVGTLYFYKAADADHFLKHGRWPESMRMD